MTASEHPWVSGPAEILRHGLSLLVEDSDTNRRLAMIAIDNAVELAIKTYLGLPTRITGLAISRKELEEAQESFPKLLTLLESKSPNKLNGVSLGDIEWYHRLRNQLYHQGNGLTVERAKVEIYSQLARLLFKNLFETDVVRAPRTQERLGTFLEQWIRIEKAISALTAPDSHKHAVAETPVFRYPASLGVLQSKGLVPGSTIQELKQLRELRNRLVHGERTLEDVLAAADTSRIAAIAQQLESLAENVSTGDQAPSGSAPRPQQVQDPRHDAQNELWHYVRIIRAAIESLPTVEQMQSADRLMRDATLFTEDDLQGLVRAAGRIGGPTSEACARAIQHLRWLRDRASEVRATTRQQGYRWDAFPWSQWSSHYLSARAELSALAGE